jgi:hypothetical protein
VVREPRQPPDDEPPTASIPVEELLRRVRAERAVTPGPGGPGPPAALRQSAQHRRPGAAPPAIGPISNPLLPRRPASRPVSSPRLPPAVEAAPPRPAEPPRAPARLELAGSEPARPRAGANVVARVTATGTLWLLAAIVVLFAVAVVLLAVTVRGLCVTAALT